jgi:hypothetical protein
MGGDELANGTAPPLTQQARRSETEAAQQTTHGVVEIAYPPDQAVTGTEENRRVRHGRAGLSGPVTFRRTSCGSGQVRTCMCGYGSKSSKL